MQDPTAEARDAAPAAPLAGTPWQLAAYRGAAGALVPAIDPETLEPERARVVAAVRQTVTVFGDGAWAGSLGCNAFGEGTYAVDGQAIRVELRFITLMECEEPLMRQEHAYAAGLRAARRYAIAGTTLTLLDADGAPALVFQMLEPLPLVGTAWRAVRFYAGRALAAQRRGPTTAAFGADGRVTGMVGGTPYAAPYASDGAAMRIGHPAAGAAGDEDWAAWGGADLDWRHPRWDDPEWLQRLARHSARAFLEALQLAVTFDIAGRVLTLWQPNRALAAQFLGPARPSRRAGDAPSTAPGTPSGPAQQRRGGRVGVMPPKRTYTRAQIDRALDRLPASWWQRSGERLRRAVAALKGERASAAKARGARNRHAPPDSP